MITLTTYRKGLTVLKNYAMCKKCGSVDFRIETNLETERVTIICPNCDTICFEIGIKVLTENMVDK